MKFDLVKLVKEIFKDKKLFIRNLPKNKIEITYKNVDKRTSPRLKSFVLPQFIKLDTEFAEATGLYLGDGKTTQNDLSHVEISSIDADIISFIFDFFMKRFYIQKENFFIEVRYKFGDTKRLVRKISKFLNVSENKIKTRKIKRSKQVSVNIQIGGTIFRKIFEKLLYISLDTIKQNKLLRMAFLRGYFAAEGTIGYNRNENYINYIGFSYNPKTEAWLRNFCMSCLKKENISSKFKERKGNRAEIIISGWVNYSKLWAIQIFDRCERKKNKFFSILKSRDIYCNLNRNFRQQMFTSLSMSQRQIASIINSHQGNVCRTIKGIHLLSKDQLAKLLSYTKLSMADVIKYTDAIRIGNAKELISDRNFIESILS